MTDYISVENQKVIAHRRKTGVILTLAFAASVLFYLLVARFLPPVSVTSGSENWVKPIYVAAVILGLAVITIRRLFMSQLLLGKVAGGGVNAVVGRLSTTTIICLSLAELVGLLGLFFYLSTGYYEYSWRLGVISLALILYSYPRRGEWDRIISRNTQ